MNPNDSIGERPSAPSRLDWYVTAAAVWMMTGLFIDAHQHLFETIDTFLNPWHITLYSGAIAAAVVLALEVRRNRRPGRSFWDCVPLGYAQSVVGVACLILGGALDAIWHAIFGFEHQLDLLLSPPHLFLLTGLFFLVTGPVRSGLSRPNATRLLDELPMVISMGVAFEVVQFVTQFGFYPEALLRDRPLPASEFVHQQFVLSVMLFYKQSTEILTVLWQSVVLAVAVLYIASRKQLHAGALVVLCVAEKLWIGGELSTDAGEFALIVLASIVAGAAGDAIVAKMRPSVARAGALRWLGGIVPATYLAAYFLFALPLFGGTWWDASFTFGCIALAGIAGVCVAQLFVAGYQARPGAA
jgi:hypothetical protein